MFSPYVCWLGYKRQKCKDTETRFSQLLIRLDDWFFLFTFLSYMSIYSVNILYIGMSFRLQKAKMQIIEIWFSWLLYKIEVWIILRRFISLMIIYSVNMLSVCYKLRKKEHLWLRVLFFFQVFNYLVAAFLEISQSTWSRFNV